MSEPHELPRIKVCGIRAATDVTAALGFGLGAVGLVAHPASPRHVTSVEGAAIVAGLPRTILPVIVLVDRDPAFAEQWITASGAGAVQLCGREVASQWRLFPAPILRRVAVTPGAEREIETWRGVAQLFVLDHPDTPGGSGACVDLERAAELALLAPCLLAGGLDATNVAERVARVRPFGVDASSRLESTPGEKDPQRVAEFVAAAARALSSVHGHLSGTRPS